MVLLPDWTKILALLLLMLAGLMVGTTTTVETPTAPVELVNVFDRSPVFQMRYPDTWLYQVGGGLIVFGEKATIFKGLPGPSISVNRPGLMFTSTLDTITLENAFQTYLRRGPLRGNHFKMLGDIAPATIDGRAALAVHLEGKEVLSDEVPLMHAYLVATQADNGQFYFLSATAPVADWEAAWPLMQAMLDTADIRE